VLDAEALRSLCHGDERSARSPQGHVSTRTQLIGLVLITLSVSAVVVLVLAKRETPKERFVAEATTICEQSKHDIDVAFNAQLSGQPTREQITTFLSNVLVPQLRDRIDRLSNLQLPEDDRDDLESLFADYLAVVDGIERDPEAAVLTEDPFAGVDARFDDYGLEACGSAPPS
jgi:hypothetical protein